MGDVPELEADGGSSRRQKQIYSVDELDWASTRHHCLETDGWIAPRGQG